jgi:hypothetical protein
MAESIIVQHVAHLSGLTKFANSFDHQPPKNKVKVHIILL